MASAPAGYATPARPSRASSAACSDDSCAECTSMQLCCTHFDCASPAELVEALAGPASAGGGKEWREWSTPEAKHCVPVGASHVAKKEEHFRRVEESKLAEEFPSGISVLESACALLDRTVLDSPGHGSNERMVVPIFHSQYVPSISASNYLMGYLVRLGMSKKEEIVDAVVLYALCLIDRLLQMQAAHGLQLCENNLHRILLVAMVLASKMLDDDPYNNGYWAYVGGVTLEHLNALEDHMTQLLDFQLVVSPRVFETIRSRLLMLC